MLLVDKIKKIADLNNEKYIIADQKYLFKIVFCNLDNSLNFLLKSAVDKAIFTDNIIEPFIKGSITILNNDNSFERLDKEQITEQGNKNTVEAGYFFRGDGRDIVYVEIIPLKFSNDVESSAIDDEYLKTYGIRQLFVIINNQDIIRSEEESTYTEYTLMDYDEFVLREKKGFFSSIELLENPDNIQFLSNSQRRVFTGKCIKRILSKGLLLNEEEIFEQDDYLKRYEDGYSKIFYSSNGNSTFHDDLMYIYNYHVSSNDKRDFSFLHKDNYTGKYELMSASYMFDNAYIPGEPGKDIGGPLHYEEIRLSGTRNNETSPRQDNKNFTSKKGPFVSARFEEKSVAKNFYFFNTDSLINSLKLKSTLINSYDENNKQFNIDYKDSNYQNVKETFNKNYVQNMKGSPPYPNLVSNSTKSLNVSINNIFSKFGGNSNLRLSEGINNLLKNGLLTNLGVELILPGQTFRKAGTFFSLERQGNFIDNKFDDKFLGIYFIIYVDHIFDKDVNYDNRVIGVKTYHFKDPNINEEIV